MFIHNVTRLLCHCEDYKDRTLEDLLLLKRNYMESRYKQYGFASNVMSVESRAIAVILYIGHDRYTKEVASRDLPYTQEC